MRILVRLPNWLGDMVMSVAFIDALQHYYKGATINVIAKKGIHDLLNFFPPGMIHRSFIFSKEEYPGLKGSWRFGRGIQKNSPHDLYFSLPDSFSSAVMGFASGAAERVGYKKEFRSALLTKSFERKHGLHRVQDYLGLLEQYARANIPAGTISLRARQMAKKDQIVINVNSEATSRRLPVQKAVEIITAVREQFANTLVLIGGRQDVLHVEDVMTQLRIKDNIINLAGKTSLADMVEELAAAAVVLTTDSGPAHAANALGVPTVVLFGAGNEKHTAPFNKGNCNIIRLGELACEPCVKNSCLLYGIPKCLEMLDTGRIVRTLLSYTAR